jgi:glutathione S-transferase
LKLYGSLASPYVARVVMSARHKGLDLEPAPPPGGLKSPEFLRMSPLGKIPALEDDGHVLVESAVILEYLEDRHPGTPMLPADAHGRALARMLARFVDLYLAPHGSTLIRAQMGSGTKDPAAIEAAKSGIAQGLVPLEHFIVGPYAAGSALTIADCTMAPTIQILVARAAPSYGLGDILAPHPKLGAWWQRIEALPLWQQLRADIDTATREFVARMAAAAQSKG